MVPFRNWAPTQWDATGNGPDEIQDFLVLPVMQTRDSGPWDQSNFAAALAILGGESATCQVHRFGHWGPGWFELILLHPDRKAEGQAIEDSMENYPVLDENDLSVREWDCYLSSWSEYGVVDFRQQLRKVFALSEAQEDILDNVDTDVLREFYQECLPSGSYCTHEGSGCHLYTQPAVHNCTEAALFSFLKLVANPPDPAQQELPFPEVM